MSEDSGGYNWQQWTGGQSDSGSDSGGQDSGGGGMGGGFSIDSDQQSPVEDYGHILGGAVFNNQAVNSIPEFPFTQGVKIQATENVATIGAGVAVAGVLVLILLAVR